MSADKNKLPNLFDDSFYNVMKSIDSYFDKSMKKLNSFFNQSMFSVNLYETKSDVVIEADLPGLKRDQIQIKILDNRVRISVEDSTVVEEQNEEHMNYRKEQSLQRYERFITLPFLISEKDTKATYKDNVLKIVTPKRERKGRSIRID